MSRTKIAQEVARRFLAGEESEDMGAPEEHTSFVPTGPSLKIFDGLVDDVKKAIESEDHKTFDKSMEALSDNWGKYKNKGWDSKKQEDQDAEAEEFEKWMSQG